MITRCTMHTAWRRGGELTALVAGMAALAVATLGFASAAGAAGNAPRLEKPSGIEGASSSAYLAGYQATPNGRLGERQRHLHRARLLVHATDKDDGAKEWTGVYTDTLESVRLRRRRLHVERPGVQLRLLDAGGQLQPARSSGGRRRRRLAVPVGHLDLGRDPRPDQRRVLVWRTTTSTRATPSSTSVPSTSLRGIPVPTFTKVKFTNATVNGDYLGFDSPTEVNTLNGGDLLMKAGPLMTSGTGSSFSVKFKHAS